MEPQFRGKENFDDDRLGKETETGEKRGGTACQRAARQRSIGKRAKGLKFAALPASQPAAAKRPLPTPGR
jgi:hypothetical protein